MHLEMNRTRVRKFSTDSALLAVGRLLFTSVWPVPSTVGFSQGPVRDPAQLSVVRRAPVCHYFGFICPSALFVAGMIVPAQVEDFLQALTRQSENVFPYHSF